MVLPEARFLSDALHQHAAERRDDIVYRFLQDGDAEQAALTFGEVDRRSRAVAHQLQITCAPGDRALLLYPAGLDFVVGFLGCLYAGVIAVPAYPPRPNRSSFVRLRAIIEECGAAIGLTTSAFLPKLRASWPPDWQWQAPLLATDAIPDAAAEGWTRPRLEDDGVALLQYTSGSTGKPKGVAITHRNLVSNLRTIRDAMGLSTASRGVIWLPPYHDMGLVGGTLQPAYMGFPVTLMSAVDFAQKPLRWLQAVARYGATISGGPNFAYDLVVRKSTAEQRAALDLSSWEVAFSGAEPVRAATLERFLAAFAPAGLRCTSICPCYGMAEATLLITSRACGTGARQVVLDGAAAPAVVGCGVPWNGTEVAIVDPETRTPVSDGALGEIWIAGDGVARGYWNREDETERVFRARLAGGGPRTFLRSGDLGFRDEGEVFVAGRLKEILIIRGRNYFPHDIEELVAAASPAFRAGGGAAIAVEVDGEERLVVFQEVEREYLRKSDPGELTSTIRRTVAEELDLQVYDVVLLKPNELPRTSSGKVQRFACAASYTPSPAASSSFDEAATVAAPAPAGGTGDRTAAVAQWLTALVARETRVPAQTIDPTRPFSELGLDSLQVLMVTGEIGDWVGCRLSPELLYEQPTIETLSRYVAALQQITEAVVAIPRERRATVLSELGRGIAADVFGEGKDIPAAVHRIDAFPEVQQLRARHAGLLGSGVRSPFFTQHEGINTETTRIDGRELINFSSNNYLGFAGDPAVMAAAQEAIPRYGTSVSASRIVSGERPVHRELEAEIASFLGVERALVFVAANLANVTTVGHLLRAQDLVLYDQLSHDSLLQGAVLSRAEAMPFAHNDWRAVDRYLVEKRRRYERVLIFIEGVYSMDGDVPDLPRFIEVKQRHRALLMVDECLSIGVLGDHGRGLAEHWAVDPSAVDVWMGGISKAFASCGGYIAGSATLVDYLRYTAPGFIYTTGISPANAAAALASIRLLRQQPERVRRLHDRTRLFLRLAGEEGLNTGTSGQTQLVPVIVGDAGECMQLYQQLYDAGINVQPVVYPAVPANGSRLRFFLTCCHSEEQIEYAVRTTAKALRSIRGAAREVVRQ